MPVAGQFSSPVLHSAIEKTIAACRKHKVTPAIHVNDLDSAVYVLLRAAFLFSESNCVVRYWKKKGMQLISVNSEMGTSHPERSCLHPNNLHSARICYTRYAGSNQRTREGVEYKINISISIIISYALHWPGSRTSKATRTGMITLRM